MFLVLEGIDGAGKGRQRIEVSKLLETKIAELFSLEFPDHQGVLYTQIIKPALLEKISIPKQAWFPAFALDQILYQDKIEEAKESNKNYFICDGYYTTNIVYNSIVNNYLDLSKALSFAKDFKINEADLNIFIDVKPEIALSRKKIEPGHEEGLDVNERDIKKQYQIREAYLKMAKEQIFGQWEVVDGNGSIEDVTDKIMKILLKYKFIK